MYEHNNWLAQDSNGVTDFYTKKEQQSFIDRAKIHYGTLYKNSLQSKDDSNSFKHKNDFWNYMDVKRDERKQRIKIILDSLKPRNYGIYIHPIFFIESDITLEEKVFLSYIINYGAVLETSEEDTSEAEFFFASRETILKDVFQGSKNDERVITKIKKSLISKGILIEKKPSDLLNKNTNCITGNSRCLWFSIEGYEKYITEYQELNCNSDDNDSTVVKQEDVEQNKRYSFTFQDFMDKPKKKKKDEAKQKSEDVIKPKQEDKLSELETQIKNLLLDGEDANSERLKVLKEEHFKLSKKQKRDRVIKRSTMRVQLIDEFIKTYSNELDPSFETREQMLEITRNVKNTSDYQVKGLKQQLEWLHIFVKVKGVREMQEHIQRQAYQGYAQLIYDNQVPDYDVKFESRKKQIQKINNLPKSNKLTQEKEKNDSDVVDDYKREDYEFWPCYTQEGLDLVKKVYSRALDCDIIYEQTTPYTSTLEFSRLLCSMFNEENASAYLIGGVDASRDFRKCPIGILELRNSYKYIEDVMVDVTGDKYYGVYDINDFK